jgi:hypothetical protein
MVWSLSQSVRTHIGLNSVVAVASTLTMAVLNTLCQMYVHLSFTNKTAFFITGTQGINIKELKNPDDKAGQALLFKAMKKPGGATPNPNANAPGAPAKIPNLQPGVHHVNQGRGEHEACSLLCLLPGTYQ